MTVQYLLFAFNLFNLNLLIVKLTRIFNNSESLYVDSQTNLIEEVKLNSNLNTITVDLLKINKSEFITIENDCMHVIKLT